MSDLINRSKYLFFLCSLISMLKIFYPFKNYKVDFPYASPLICTLSSSINEINPPSVEQLCNNLTDLQKAQLAILVKQFPNTFSRKLGLV